MRKKYICSNCGFKFETSLEPKKCPNCARENTVYLEMKDEELIKDINDILNEK